MWQESIMKKVLYVSFTQNVVATAICLRCHKARGLCWRPKQHEVRQQQSTRVATTTVDTRCDNNSRHDFHHATSERPTCHCHCLCNTINNVVIIIIIIIENLKCQVSINSYKDSSKTIARFTLSDRQTIGELIVQVVTSCQRELTKFACRLHTFCGSSRRPAVRRTLTSSWKWFYFIKPKRNNLLSTQVYYSSKSGTTVIWSYDLKVQ